MSASPHVARLAAQVDVESAIKMLWAYGKVMGNLLDHSEDRSSSATSNSGGTSGVVSHDVLGALVSRIRVGASSPGPPGFTPQKGILGPQSCAMAAWALAMLQWRDQVCGGGYSMFRTTEEAE